MGRPTLDGPGRGIYRTGVKALPPGHARALLKHATEGGNALLGHVTDPATFDDGTGQLDVDEQLITWSDIRFGFDAINALASDWSSHESIWAAFRALTTLQCVWDGRRKKGIPCPSCFSPRTCALSSCR